MKIFDLIRRLIRDYFVIFGLLMIGSVFFTPPNAIDRDYVLLTMTFAALGDLPSLVLLTKSEGAEESRKWRAVAHFILLEVVILAYAGMTGLVSGTMGYLGFALQILIIYVLVKFITYRGDLATANEINEKLKMLKVLDEAEAVRGAKG